MRRLAFCLALLGFALPAHAQNMDAELKNLEWVGFQQFQEASRVFVRTSDPVKYRTDTSRPNMVVLILENVRVGLTNNTRPLDTHFFESPVRSIWPRVIEAPGPAVQIEIYMRKMVPFKTTQTDNVIALDFERDQ